jgi:excisionase family DNA binding protein
MARNNVLYSGEHPLEAQWAPARTRPQNDRNPDTHLLTVEQAAKKCQLSVRHLRRLIKAGKLPVIRFGKAVRIHPKHLGL